VQQVGRRLTQSRRGFVARFAAICGAVIAFLAVFLIPTCAGTSKPVFPWDTDFGTVTWAIAAKDGSVVLLSGVCVLPGSIREGCFYVHEPWEPVTFTTTFGTFAQSGTSSYTTTTDGSGLATATLNVPAPSEAPLVRVTNTNENNQPVAGAAVRIEWFDGGSWVSPAVAGRTETRESLNLNPVYSVGNGTPNDEINEGGYVFNQLPPNRSYRITVSKTGYTTRQVTVPVSTGLTIQDIDL